MRSMNKMIVEQALAARTVEEAEAVQKLIADTIGATHKRPLGDRWNNQGFLTGSGSSYDHKVLETVTNMQDAVLELLVLQKLGSRDEAKFPTPHAAAANLLAGLGPKQQAEFATVTIDRAEPGRNKKRITLVMRDRGCGITDEEVPRGIFLIGDGHKDGVDWQQGTFGLGGATPLRNAKAVVLVTRRHPDLLKSEEVDKITIAVVQWERERTTKNAFYLVTHPWNEDVPAEWVRATPFSVLASDFPDFDAGTHLALIAYDTAGLGRISSDERSFASIFDTRLYRPVLPIKYRNNITRSNRDETLRGLHQRLEGNPGVSGTEGQDTLPFNYKDTTYRLPISYRLFAKPGDPGERRNFIAHGHALLLTSNGQVHSHWTPQEFKQYTKLNKLYNRVLVVVESDALPIEDRTELFTADRSQLIRSSFAIRLEKEIAAFLDEWVALQHANNALILEAVSGDNSDRPTVKVAEQIARAVKAKGYSFGGEGSGGGGGSRSKSPNPLPPDDLYDDPNHFEGPESVEAQLGKVKSIHFQLNAVDGFISKRAELEVVCDHPDIGVSEITVGELQSGRVRVSVAVPENADLGICKLSVEILPWVKTSGGLGPSFEWTTKVEVVEEREPKSSGRSPGSDKGKSGTDSGGLVALIWKSESDPGTDNWTAATVGEIEMVVGRELAKVCPEYSNLAEVDSEIPTIVLNRTYTRLKSYVHARAAELSTDDSVYRARDRYAVGAGVALLLLDQETRKAEKEGKPLDDKAIAVARQAAARAVLSVLPAYDRLERQTLAMD
ncbi:hypothetical protein [Candidatus Poriferisocius sp.]|uniref:hypothetical protein n=1 Tax=Candidatus Poriferisocius sp. TaxID=3101276 RepID=UPI003B5B3230